MAKKEKREPLEPITFGEVMPQAMIAKLARLEHRAAMVSWLKVFLSHAWEVGQRHEPGEELARVVDGK